MNLVVIGAQWGDEGKGKIVDFLSERSDAIVRYSGGANAGHTIVIDDETYKLHLVPSGIINEEKAVILGTGMVVDLDALFSELQMIEERGISWEGRVFISERAHIVLPVYKNQDKKRETTRKKPIGTTGRGIGITYAHKAYRDGLRVVDMFEPDIVSEFDDETQKYIKTYRERIRSMMISITDYMDKRRDKNILYEGAQGILLDLDLGTYPYVSSGMSSASGAAVGGGIGPREIDKVIGVFKAYTTRVGNGPFPSEFIEKGESELEEYIRERGREYGVTTGRARRCGYLDLVALRYACKSNSIGSLALTHLDVYDELEKIKACTAYQYNGEEFSNFPSANSVLEGAKPVFREFSGWQTDISGCRDFSDLPKQAKIYLEFIEDYTETNIDIISVGYQRKQTIIRRDPWQKF